MATVHDVEEHLRAACQRWRATDIDAVHKEVYTAFPSLLRPGTLPVPAPPPGTVCSYFHTHAVALQQEHSRAKQSNCDTQYIGFMNGTEAVQWKGTGEVARWKVQLVFGENYPEARGGALFFEIRDTVQ